MDPYDPLTQLLLVSGRELPVLLTALLGGLLALGFVRRRGKAAVLAFLGCGLLFLTGGALAVDRVNVQQSRVIAPPRSPIGRPLRDPPPALTLLDVGVGAGQVAGLSLLIAAALAGHRGSKPAG